MQEISMNYVDGFVSQVLDGRLEEYRKMADQVAQVFMEYGALGYVEALGDDVPYGKLTSFPRAILAPEGAQIVFSFALYRDRAHRDAVTAKVFADPRMQMKPAEMPIDMGKMIFGGFVPIANQGVLADN
jgi:uncharacterized protein YbaA (DUF1428 family)